MIRILLCMIVAIGITSAGYGQEDYQCTADEEYTLVIIVQDTVELLESIARRARWNSVDVSVQDIQAYFLFRNALWRYTPVCNEGFDYAHAALRMYTDALITQMIGYDNRNFEVSLMFWKRSIPNQKLLVSVQSNILSNLVKDPVGSAKVDNRCSDEDRQRLVSMSVESVGAIGHTFETALVGDTYDASIDSIQEYHSFLRGLWLFVPKCNQGLAFAFATFKAYTDLLFLQVLHSDNQNSELAELFEQEFAVEVGKWKSIVSGLQGSSKSLADSGG